MKLIDLILRPQLDIRTIAEWIPALKEQLDMIPTRQEEIIEAAEICIKYEGYIEREKLIADKIARLENIRIKGKFDYSTIQQISIEAQSKTGKDRPGDNCPSIAHSRDFSQRHQHSFGIIRKIMVPRGQIL